MFRPSLMVNAQHACRKRPQRRGTEQKPIRIRVGVADVQRARAESEEPDHPRDPANDHPGEQDLLEEIQQHREPLLHLGDIVIVDAIERRLQAPTSALNSPGDFLRQRIRRAPAGIA